MLYQIYVTQPYLCTEAVSLANVTKSISVIEDFSQIIIQVPYLLLDEKGLSVVTPNLKPILVRDIYAKLSFRIRGNKDLLVDAVSFKSKANYIQVLDITAGLGIDAALLSFNGCKVTMLERNPILVSIMYYALQHGYLPKTNLELIFTDSAKYLTNYPIDKANPDVIYFDPMFNDGNTKSLAKQNMQLIQLLNLAEEADSLIDNQELFLLAFKYCSRVVVKRDNRQIAIIDRPLTSYSKLGKTVRFDVYNR